ncbi:hypothetical protein ACQP1W_11325 [Spirillospora sp. CA-255316]
MQATVRHFDPGTRSGSVLLDDGTELPFDTEAFDAGGLRLLRLGQRVNIAVEGGGDEAGGGEDGEDETRGGEAAAEGGEDAAGAEQGHGRITVITLSTFPLP